MGIAYPSPVDTQADLCEADLCELYMEAYAYVTARSNVFPARNSAYRHCW